MKFKEKPLTVLGLILIPLSYIVALLVFHDPDSIVFSLGLFGAPLWLFQWIGFLVGGWGFAIFFTVLFLGLVGFLVGRFSDYIVSKFKTRR
jgi:hypothetical protein